MFDVQVKRIHEYKRQHLSALHIAALYHRLKSQPQSGHRAAHLHLWRQGGAGLCRAKLMIKLITAIGDVINNDPDVRDRLKVRVPAELQRDARPMGVSRR